MITLIIQRLKLLFYINIRRKKKLFYHSNTVKQFVIRLAYVDLTQINNTQNILYNLYILVNSNMRYEY